MWYSHQRKLTVNMGDKMFESFTFEVSVGLGHSDLGYSDTDMQEMDRKQSDEVWEELRTTVLSRLDAQLVQEVQDAQALTLHPNSFVLRAQHLPKPKPQPAAETTSRRVIRRAH